MSIRKIAQFSAMLMFAATTSVVSAEDGVTPNEVVIGMSNALTGPASGLGTGIKSGSTACFDRVNAAGGGEWAENQADQLR